MKGFFFFRYLKRYLSSKFILCIDLLTSVMASTMTVIFFWSNYPLPHSPLVTATVWLGCALLYSLFFFYLLKMNRSVIRHSTFREVGKLLLATLGKEALMVVTFFPYELFQSQSTLAYFVFAIDMLLTFFGLILVRLCMLSLYEHTKWLYATRQKRRRVFIYGVGTKSVALYSRFSASKHYQVLGFLQRGKNLHQHSIMGAAVFDYEEEDDLHKIFSRYRPEGVLFASDIDAKNEENGLIRYALNHGIKLYISPVLNEMNDGKLQKQGIRNIKIEDLLGREEISLPLEHVKQFMTGKCVLVTGAAGSIGSELCRQLAVLGVRELVLYDNGETPLHNIRLELEERFPDLNFVPVIGDVRVLSRMRGVFERYRPQVVFHAAAYKHVPLMEENPCEAVWVNVLGSKQVADLCREYEVEEMVMISTDKAVNPTNIMGCTKRLAEIYVQALGLAITQGQLEGKTKFVTTRFGNVLGSNGSVIPRFREQISKGGPITVTHPEITRFFMTVPEACRLVMEAAILTSGNQIFVFDMGESVKIVDLARKMIELAGYKPDEDIKISFCGLRPGEKLYEEVLTTKENVEPTQHKRIHIAKVRENDYQKANEAMIALSNLAKEHRVEEMVRMMKAVVPEFKSQNSKFKSLDTEQP